MRKIPARLAIAVMCFAVGLFAAEINRLCSLPEVVVLEEPPPVYLPREPSCFPGLSISIPEHSAPRSFGGIPLSDNEWCNQFRIDWYSKALKAMDEGPLCSRSNEEESYRFLWLRSFDHPIAIRVQRFGSNRLVVVKELERSRSDEVAGNLKTFSFPLSDEEWNLITLNLDHACFWQMPTSKEIMMNDGAQWIMEGYREGRYHVVDRQSPEDGAYRDACLYLLRAAHVLGTIPKSRIY
jgi:hypothetical protein